jgi:anthranilate synthase component 1
MQASVPLLHFSKKLLGDVHTPVGLYLKLRDRFPQSLLLESADYHGKDNAMSFICLEPFAEFRVEGSVGFCEVLGKKETFECPKSEKQLVSQLEAFLARFQIQEVENSKIPHLGAFGFMSYSSASHFDSLKIREEEKSPIPTAIYKVFRFVLALDHFNDSLHFFEQFPAELGGNSRIPEIESLIDNKNIAEYPFRKVGEEKADQSDQDFLNSVQKGMQHCFRGDVFQIVLSRRFSQAYHGDEFNVYRKLRHINPSPYLFFFDFGSFKLFGSSPEAQIDIRDNKASIYPIAGTFRRTGNDDKDQELANRLLEDEKENAEHIMLVDLARNDLSLSCSLVEVEKLKEVQFYSHVIHLVSKVTGTLSDGSHKLQLVADTFPAGTLSGAPKFKAMELINALEASPRGFYAGCIGYVGFNQDFNHAIMIRSFYAKDNVLHFQAGAGVVAKSVPENELQEVKNKLSALRSAIDSASEIAEF